MSTVGDEAEGRLNASMEDGARSNGDSPMPGDGAPPDNHSSSQTAADVTVVPEPVPIVDPLPNPHHDDVDALLVENLVPSDEPPPAPIPSQSSETVPIESKTDIVAAVDVPSQHLGVDREGVDPSGEASSRYLPSREDSRSEPLFSLPPLAAEPSPHLTGSDPLPQVSQADSTENVVVNGEEAATVISGSSHPNGLTDVIGTDPTAIVEEITPPVPDALENPIVVETPVVDEVPTSPTPNGPEVSVPVAQPADISTDAMDVSLDYGMQHIQSPPFLDTLSMPTDMHLPEDPMTLPFDTDAPLSDFTMLHDLAVQPVDEGEAYLAPLEEIPPSVDADDFQNPELEADIDTLIVPLESDPDSTIPAFTVTPTDPSTSIVDPTVSVPPPVPLPDQPSLDISPQPSSSDAQGSASWAPTLTSDSEMTVNSSVATTAERIPSPTQPLSLPAQETKTSPVPEVAVESEPSVPDPAPIESAPVPQPNGASVAVAPPPTISPATELPPTVPQVTKSDLVAVKEDPSTPTAIATPTPSSDPVLAALVSGDPKAGTVLALNDQLIKCVLFHSYSS